MSRSEQEKVKAAIEKAATDYGLELVQSANYGNTGTWFIEEEGSTAPIVTIRYSFQYGYASFEISPYTDPKLSYVLHDELQSRVIQPVRELLAKAHHLKIEKELAS